MRTFPKIFLCLCLLWPGFASAQGKRIQELIDSLSWGSVTMNCMGGTLVLTHNDKAEQELIKAGEKVAPQLVAALGDHRKTVIIHMILTQVFEPEQSNEFGTVYIYKDCNTLIGWHHIYNGLVWEWNEESHRTIAQQEVDQVTAYWKARLQKRSAEWESSTRRIMDRLHDQDKKQYPCRKVYSNESAGMKAAQLTGLIGKKETGPEFQKLWQQFGNDSTISRFAYNFYVNYGPEGLSFNFGKDSVLNIIFVDKNYKGDLPGNIKLTDRRSEIISKLGPPDKTNYPAMGWSYYAAASLYFYYADGDEIRQFYISKKEP